MHLDQNNVEHTKPSSEQLHGLTDAEVSVLNKGSSIIIVTLSQKASSELYWKI